MNNAHSQGYLCAIGAVLIWSGFILVSRVGGISPLLPYDVIAIRYVTRLIQDSHFKRIIHLVATT